MNTAFGQTPLFAVCGRSKDRDNAFALDMAIKERLEKLHIVQRCGQAVRVGFRPAEETASP